MVIIALVFRGQRQHLRAIIILDEARGLFSSAENEYGLASAYHELAFANRELGRNTVALDQAHKAVSIFEKLRRALESAWALDNLSVIHSNLFQRHESLIFAKKARAIFAQHGSQDGLGWNACHLAHLYLGMGFHSRAHRLYTEAIDIFTKLESQQGKAWGLLGLATVHRALCQFRAADDLLIEAKGIYEELGLVERVGWCLLHQAALKRVGGQNDPALLLNKRALQLFSPLRINEGVAWGLFQAGQIFRERGQLVKAWQTVREALNLHTDLSHRAGMGWAEKELGKIYLELNDQAHARECFIRAKIAADQLDAGPLKAEVDKNLAGLCMDEGLFQKAFELLEKAEALCQKIEAYDIQAEVRIARAHYHLMIGDAARARLSVEAANDLIRKHEFHRLKTAVGVTLGEILMAEGKVENAVSVWNSVATIAKPLGHRRHRAEALLGLAQAQRPQKTPTQFAAMIYQIEKDVRALGSRKLRGKLLLVKGLLTAGASGPVDARFIDQGIQVLEAAGLSALQRQALGALTRFYQRSGLKQEADRCAVQTRQLLQGGSVDLHLIEPRPELIDILPVSPTA